MAKLLSSILNLLKVKNATSSGGGVSGFTRDPKTTTVKRVGLVVGADGEQYEESEVDLSQIKTAISRDSYLMQTVMKYSELLFKSGYSISGRDEAALEYLNMRLSMMEIATNQTMHELWKGIGEDVVRYSNSFIIKARAKGGVGLPPGLNILPTNGAKEGIGGYFRLAPETVKILRDANGTIKSYQQEVEGGGDPIDIKPIDMIHIRVNVQTGSAYGVPFLAPVLEDVRLLRKVEENIGLLLYRHIFPLIAYKVGIAEKGYESSDEEIEEISSTIDQMPTDGAIVLPERHNIEAVKIDPIEAKPYLDYFENRVFSGVGLSSVDFGRGDTANRNTADAMGGIKADRVKGWQQDIQEQIDLHIIDELLAEGGFDPIVNPEWDCEFMFNEIQLDQRIAKESHEINKFNNNLQSWEETRTALGMEPATDEARLQFQMIGIATAAASAAMKAESGGDDKTEAGKNTSASKTQPENQNGKSTKAERFAENESRNALVKKDFMTYYREMETLSINKVKRIQERKGSEEINSRELRFGNEPTLRQMVRTLESEMNLQKDKALANSREAIGGRVSPLQTELFNRVMKAYIDESLASLTRHVNRLIEVNVDKARTPQEQLLAIKGAYHANEYKVKQIINSVSQKAYNYAYMLRLKQEGMKEAHIIVEDSACSSCKEQAEEVISLKKWGMLEELSAFYKIPPFHPNCYCEVHYKEVKD